MVNTPFMILQNPKVISTKERPSGTTNKWSTNLTRRDPSGFEFIDQRGRKCTLCNQPGHNSRTCQLNSN